MTDGDREFEKSFPGKTALDIFPMDGSEKACPRCSLEFKTLMHPFCQHRYCPPRERAQAIEARSGETGTGSIRQDESAVRQDAPNTDDKQPGDEK